MRVKIKFLSTEVSATVVKGQEQTRDNPEYPDELIDISYDKNEIWFNTYKEQIISRLWDEVERQVEINKTL